MQMHSNGADNGRFKVCILRDLNFDELKLQIKKKRKMRDGGFST